MINDIIENRSTLKTLLDNILATDNQGLPLVLEEALESTIDMITEKSQEGGQLLFIGNGGSAAISSHMATDFWKNAGIRATAFNDSVLLTCISNDHGYKYVFEKAIEMHGTGRDILIAISSSGRSENILRGVFAAQEKKMAIITFSGFDKNNLLRGKGDINFYVPASHYGRVEVIHHALCHCLIDVIIKNKASLGERVKTT